MILVVVRIQDPDLQMTLSFCEESPKSRSGLHVTGRWLFYIVRSDQLCIHANHFKGRKSKLKIKMLFST